MQSEVKQASKQQIQEKAKKSILEFLHRVKHDSSQREENSKNNSSKTGYGALRHLILQANRHYFQVLCDYFHLLERWKEEYAPKQSEDDWHSLFVEALRRQPYIEYLLDILLSDSIKKRVVLVVEYRKR